MAGTRCSPEVSSLSPMLCLSVRRCTTSGCTSSDTSDTALLPQRFYTSGLGPWGSFAVILILQKRRERERESTARARGRQQAGAHHMGAAGCRTSRQGMASGRRLAGLSMPHGRLHQLGSKVFLQVLQKLLWLISCTWLKPMPTHTTNSLLASSPCWKSMSHHCLPKRKAARPCQGKARCRSV